MYKRWKQGWVRNAKAKPEFNLVRDKQGFFRLSWETRKVSTSTFVAQEKLGKTWSHAEWGRGTDDKLHEKGWSSQCLCLSLYWQAQSSGIPGISGQMKSLRPEGRHTFRRGGSDEGAIELIGCTEVHGTNGLSPQVLKGSADVTTRLLLIISERLGQLEEVPEDKKRTNYTYLHKEHWETFRELQARQVDLSLQ